jgi:hypothetical protein
MLKQNIKFKDFNDVPREETLFFNLSEAELVEIQLNSKDGIQKEMEDAVKAKDLAKLLAFIKMLIGKAYGVPNKDGIHFDKSPEITRDFENSAMYSPLLLSLFQDEGKRAEKFITGLMPAELVQRALSQVQSGTAQPTPQDATVPDVAPSAREMFAQRQAERAQEDVIDATTPTFQPPVPAAPVQSSPSPQDAPPIDAQPFRIKEEPLPPVDVNFDNHRAPADDDERAAFEAWKAQRNQA